MGFYRVSKILQPKVIVPPGKTRNTDSLSISQKLLHDLGLIRSSNIGSNVILPLAYRSLEKLKKLVRKKLTKYGAHEISLPLLNPLALLKKTGRDSLPELFKLRDRHDKEYIISPTNEESIVDFIAGLNVSYKQLPLQLYQISPKFRDEMKPKFGLLRSREFLMKDMYCFSSSLEESEEIYENVNLTYKSILDTLQVPYSVVKGSSGDIGGSLSHEFHILSDIGEDNIFICKICGSGEDLVTGQNDASCLKCGQATVVGKRGIEVGHSFLLGTTYTLPLNANFTAVDKSNQLLHMTCHGIGMTRLLAASVEALSSEERIRWPSVIAPFSVCIIPPKSGSKEEGRILPIEAVLREVNELFPEDIILDDRTDLTIGKRLLDAKRIGYLFAVILGKATIGDVPKVELIRLADNLVEIVPLVDLKHAFSTVLR